MLENDLILQEFMRRHGTVLAGGKLDSFKRLLTLSDGDLWDLIGGRSDTKDEAVEPRSTCTPQMSIVVFWMPRLLVRELKLDPALVHRLRMTASVLAVVPSVLPLIEGIVTDIEYLAQDVEMVALPTAVLTSAEGEPPVPKVCTRSTATAGVPVEAFA